MSAESVKTSAPVVNVVEGQVVASAEAETVEAAKTATKVAKPFKLPYADEFDVEFKDVHLMKEYRKYSEPVTFGPLKWRLLLFPRGNPSTSQAKNHMSAYLDVAEADVMEEGWRLQTVVGLQLKNQICSSRDVNRTVPHKFHMSARDIGYAQFHPLRELYEPLEGFYVNNTLKFHVTFRVTQSWVERPEDSKAANGKGWNSKKETGFVGLQNQGATCYLNSLLQSMYHLPRFRHLVYSIKTEPNSSAASLQRLFWNLEHDDDSVSTTELTKSFGWNIEDIAVQHDVQELLRKLVDKLEEKVKDGPQKGVFEQLFRGTYMDILKCINVDYERRQEIAFCDLSLNVAGCDTLEEALRKFTETETLDGDNRYKSEQFGYQDAHKGIKLNSLPPVLHLHLKRFDYQYQNDPPTLEKVNAKQVFPPVLKMGEFLDNPMDDTDETTYDLFGVLVHSGSAQAGHYYAFLRPSIEPNWFKFDDSKVSHAEIQEAIDDNFGGDEITEIKVGGLAENTQRFATEKHSSAYMLVYVKRTDTHVVFSDARLGVTETDFVDRMKREMEELRIAEQKRLEALQYTQIRVYTIHSLCDALPADWDGKSMPILDHAKSSLVTIKHSDLVKHLKVAIDQQLGIPAVRQRLWSVRESHDDILTLERPITVEHCNRSIEAFNLSRAHMGRGFTDVFVEVNEDLPLETDAVALESEMQPHLRDGDDDASHGINTELGGGVGLGGGIHGHHGMHGDGYGSFDPSLSPSSAGSLQKGFPPLDDSRLIFVRYWHPETQLFTLLGQCFIPNFNATLDLLKDAVTPLLAKANLIQQQRDLLFFLSEMMQPVTEALNNMYLQMHQLSHGSFLTVQYEVLTDANGHIIPPVQQQQPTNQHESEKLKSDEKPRIDSTARPDDSETVPSSEQKKDMKSEGNVALDDGKSANEAHEDGSKVETEKSAVSVEKSAAPVTVRWKTFYQYVRFLRSRVTLEFYDLANRDTEPIPLPFTLDSTMGEVLSVLGSALQWDPKKISLMDVHAGTKQPRTNPTMIFDDETPITRALTSTSYMASYAPVSVFYDLLDVPVSEIRGKTQVKCHFVDHALRSHPVTLYLPPPIVIQHVLDAARQNPRIRDHLTAPDVPLRAFDFEEHHFQYRLRHAAESVTTYYSTQLGIEEIYAEEIMAPPGSSRVVVFLMTISSSRVYTKATHRPFSLCVYPDETMGSVKDRIRKRLKLEKDEEIEAFLKDPAFQDTPPCEDSSIVSEIDAQHLYCHIIAPQKQDTSPISGATPAPNNNPNTQPTTQVKEKPRNALHLGD